MIRYALKCPSDHGFDSWFQSAEAYEALCKAGLVSCPLCGSGEVEKSLMTPAVRPVRTARTQEDARKGSSLTEPASDLEQALAALRRQVEENSDYVGMNFVAEARRIQAGEAPERSIYGEAGLDDARALLEEGVPVAPLPFIPQRKTN